MRPLVSVITVVYNGEEDIEKTIDSVLNQEYRDFEYIVIDGKSTDGTTKLIEQYKSGIDTFISEADGGLYFAMNKGVALSKGKFILFMHCGDYFFDTHSLGYLASHVFDNDIVYGKTKLYTYGNYGEKICFDRKKKELSQIEYGSTFCHQSALVSKDLLLKFPFSTNYRNADYEHIFKSIHSGAKVSFIDRYVNYFKLGGISSYVSIKDCWECWKNLKELLTLKGHLYFVFRMAIIIPVRRLLRALLPTKAIFKLLYN